MQCVDQINCGNRDLKNLTVKNNKQCNLTQNIRITSHICESF